MVKLLAVLILATSVLAVSNLESHKVLYHRSDVPNGSDWKLWKEPDQDQSVTFSLALKQLNLDKLEELFWANSDPTSPQFAKHMTRKEILNLVSPSKEVQTLIIDWLETAAEEVASKINIVNKGDMMQITAPVVVVNHLFKTNIHAFANSKTRQIVFKHLGSLSVPSILSDHIEMVTGITEFPPASTLKTKKYQSESTLEDGNGCNVPYTIRQLYGVPANLTVTNPLVNASVYSEYFTGQEEFAGFDVPQLSDFELANGLASNPVNCILGNAAQYYNPQGDGLEAVLDIQMIEGMAPGANFCFYVMDANFGWMYEFANQIFHTPNAPLVVSMSYAWNEDNQCQSDAMWVKGLGNCTALNIPNSQVYVERTNVEFMKLGLAGFTLLASSGDDGTVGAHSSLDGCTTMEPLFPASSPYVTAVGATSIEPSTTMATLDSGSLPPVCTNSSFYCVCSTSTNEQPALVSNTAGFASGGGFSNFNPMPDYQKKAIQAYLNSGVVLPTPSLWSSSGRGMAWCTGIKSLGYPDVAAVGENFCTIDAYDIGCRCMLMGGTSASAPLWAGLVTLLNQDRINAGKTALGFINPMLYQMFDISTWKYFRNNFSDGNNSGECDKSMGFNAQSGYWTPLTGLGSPHFDQIRQYVASLP